jgi:hypothetical protein
MAACHAGSSTQARTFSATHCTEASAEPSAAHSPPTVRPPEAATAGPSTCSHNSLALLAGHEFSCACIRPCLVVGRDLVLDISVLGYGWVAVPAVLLSTLDNAIVHVNIPCQPFLSPDTR